MNKEDLLSIYAQDVRVKEFIKLLSSGTESKRWGIKGLVGSARALVSAAIASQLMDKQLFILRDKEQAAYFYNDLEKMLGEMGVEQATKKVLFYPSSYRNPYEVENVDNANVLQRTEVLNRLGHTKEKLWIITYPEALTEKVITKRFLEQNTVKLSVEDTVSQDFLIDFFHEYDFEQVDFVIEAGQFSVRGGIIDVFSFANDSPYRIEFFGDKIESIRSFDVVSQLSLEKQKSISLLPNVQQRAEHIESLSFLSYFSSYANVWFEDVQWCLDSMEKLYSKACDAFAKLETPLIHRKPQELYIRKEDLLADLRSYSVIEFGMAAYFKHHASISFSMQTQPLFNKKFELLVEHIQEGMDHDYTYFILSENAKQIQRLERVFFELAPKDHPLRFTPLFLSLNEGFIDNDLKLAIFTDHQIFERYHRYSVQPHKQDTQALSLRELYMLKPGDYVSHIDHGVGRFAGLEKIKVNGREQEAICLVYKDNDVLHISIHALHKMSRYASKDGSIPQLHRLGSNTWANLKQKTKQKVKDIAKDLIKLYAQRKASPGFAYSADSYLQHELESSFFYEDTPDQLKATQDVKQDMESSIPMDRLICGDVGFGKTEVAIRAAFKAVADGKQVAVLVPTTVLAYQHAKTFKERLENLPCTVDYINRFRSTKEKKDILARLKVGKIDILIGTHRLVSKDVLFKDLGLLIVDEEQKFGVSMKEKLKQLKVNLDTLTLTATPIPRTLQFSLMGARDLSIINTPPQNRYPVQTEIHPFNEEIIRDAIVYELNRGGQVFFVHHRVQNIMEIAGMLQRLIPDAKIGVAHGQMEGDKLEEILLGFIEGEYDILVSTKIVENGLDISNANTMIINEAHSYGLSELHQLRGRVGRSNKKAFCYLMTPPSYMLSEEAKKRLRAIEEFSDIGSGFQIAMRDLDIRGAGNILGGEQSGFISEIGMDMYQKILDEAIQELKETEFKDLYPEETQNKIESKECQIETDLEILIPDQYVSNISERLSLYKELDGLESDAELKAFSTKLIDRFGPIPEPTQALIDTLRLRRFAKALGWGNLSLRGGKLVGSFVAESDTAYFQSDVFGRIVSYVQIHAKNSCLKEQKSHLNVVFNGIQTIEEALHLMQELQ
ncbi:MAG: transcription-repair coupling factor [Bacteroidales bacterium]